nr:MAG TPA: hypothetical protein [Caudoviricetes sp.]
MLLGFLFLDLCLIVSYNFISFRITGHSSTFYYLYSTIIHKSDNLN